MLSKMPWARPVNRSGQGVDDVLRSSGDTVNNFLEQALALVKAQACFRALTADEMVSMLEKLSDGLRPLAEAVGVPPKTRIAPGRNGGRGAKPVVCLECGKSFRRITAGHLASHGLTVELYKAKYDLDACMPLTSKPSRRAAGEKMRELRRLREAKQKVKEQPHGAEYWLGYHPGVAPVERKKEK